VIPVLRVAPRGPPAESDQAAGVSVVKLVPFLGDPADQVDLVVHRQAENRTENITPG